MGSSTKEVMWKNTAIEFANNADYYRKLVVEIGDLFGIAARTADDGSIMEDVLCAKVPELVKELLVKLRRDEKILNDLIIASKNTDGDLTYLLLKATHRAVREAHEALSACEG